MAIAGVIALAASPNVSKLVELALDMNGIGSKGSLALARSHHLDRLHTLSLYGNPAITEVGIKALLGLFGVFCL